MVRELSATLDSRSLSGCRIPERMRHFFSLSCHSAVGSTRHEAIDRPPSTFTCCYVKETRLYKPLDGIRLGLLPRFSPFSSDMGIRYQNLVGLMGRVFFSIRLLRCCRHFQEFRRRRRRRCRCYRIFGSGSWWNNGSSRTGFSGAPAAVNEPRDIWYGREDVVWR